MVKKSPFNFGTLFGDPDLQNMMQRVDDLTSSLDKKSNQDMQSAMSSDKALNDIIALISSEETVPRTVENTSSNSIQHLLQNISIPAQRSNRYRAYDELYSSVQIIKRIIRVYANNILQKDIVTGKSLTLLESTKFNENTLNLKAVREFSKSIIKHYKLEQQLTNKLVQDLLRYGDAYIEIIDLKNDVFNLPSATNQNTRATIDSSSLITESSANDYINYRKDIEYLKNLKDTAAHSSSESLKYTLESESINKFVDYFIDFEDSKNAVTPDLLIEETKTDNFISSLMSDYDKIDRDQEKLRITDFKPINLNRFLLRFHSPKSMVNLTTVYNDNVLGYVEVREQEGIERVPGVGLQFATILKQISVINKDKIDDISGVIRKIVQRIIFKIVEKSGVSKKFNKNKNAKQVNAEFEKMLMAKIGDDLFYMVKKLYNESDQEGGPNKPKLGVRYIAPDNMIHLCLNPIEFAPYGTSVIDPLIYPAKLYLLTQLTNMVTKLSRASLIRKWTIEAGPREHGTNLMQKLKREIRNQRVTVDDIVSFKAIPKILSD